MKIVHINTWDAGGAANAALRLYRAQLKQNVDASFLSLKPKEAKKEDVNYYVDFLSSKYGKAITGLIIFANRVYNQLPTRFNKSIFFNRPNSFYSLHTHPLVKHADIIHFHATIKFLDIPSFFKKVNKPVVWTLHDMNPFSGGKHYDSMMRDELISWEKKFVTIKKNALKGANILVVSPSAWLMHLSEKSEVFERFPHFNIPNCISQNDFGLINGNKLSTKKTVLFVAESIKDERKGFQYFLKSLLYLSEDVRVIVIGNVSRHDFGEHSNIQFLGYISDVLRLREVYASADVYVISSLEDNLPNTVLESQMCGTPVVGFNTSGIADMIKNGVNGVLVDEVSGEQLAEGIHQALALLEEGVISNRTIAEDAKTLYAEERVVRLYKTVYEKAY